MTKVLELDEKERVREEKERRILEVTKQTASGFRVSNDILPTIINIYPPNKDCEISLINIAPTLNLICVYDRKSFSVAERLVRAYEDAGEEEFTIEEKYRG